MCARDPIRTGARSTLVVASLVASCMFSLPVFASDGPPDSTTLNAEAAGGPSWRDIFTIKLTDAYSLAIEVGPILYALGIAAGVAMARRRRGRRPPSWSAVEAEVQLGGIGAVKIRPSYEDIQIAHRAWVELVTRKAALPFDEDHDVIREVYNSWYALFQEMRSLAKAIPAEKVRRSKDTRELVRLLVDALNRGIRPHLTQWQARFRHWYDEAIRSIPERSPQEVQRDYPQYQELVDDLKKVNRELVAYAEVIREIAHGKGKLGE